MVALVAGLSTCGHVFFPTRKVSFALRHLNHRNAHQCPRTFTCFSTEGNSYPSPTPFDEDMMRRALDLAEKGRGHTHPNPMVGCVIVSSNDPNAIVGEGYHPKAGLPHAEVYALRAAGQFARGATAYVTLEPCDHYGRTPPCSQSLIDAGVSRVVVGVGDPNPLVDGGGISRLRKAGIEVVVGCLEEECFAINQEFMERMMS
jgi:diaminohydroxyphosphoribosylaminopyrimidine deaminase/5-amino-6-(5-phosphoribosylamino)uracil reductase